MATKPTPPRKTVIQPVSRELVLKATDDSDPVACYDQSGRLMGICDPKDITPIANPAGSADPKQPAKAESPEMAVAKARAAAREIKRGLYAGGSVADREKLATAMNAAAIQVEKQIHRGQRRG